MCGVRPLGSFTVRRVDPSNNNPRSRSCANREEIMTIDHDDVAVQLVYLVAGTEWKVKLHEITGRLTDDQSDHPMRTDGGHIGMVNDLLPYARQVSEFLSSQPSDREYPGVFEYEVTESLGAWLADNWEPATHDLFKAELEAQATAFFTR
jgi:hypothetical protein